MIHTSTRTVLNNDRDGVKIGSNVTLEPGAVIYDGCSVGDNSIIGANAVLRPFTEIGKNTIFGTSSVSEGHNVIGNDTTIHAQCHITSDVYIGDRCFIAPFFIASNTPSITTGKHGVNKAKYSTESTLIGDDVRIGICVSLIPGVTIGHNSLIDQNCLITKDIKPFSHVRGGGDQIGRVIE